MLSPNPKRRRKRSLKLRLQMLEQRCLLAGDTLQNFVEPEDVNLDGSVTLEDAIQVINRLNETFNSQLIGKQPFIPADTTFLADVDNNQTLTTGDALRVINQIPLASRTAAELDAGIRQLSGAILSETLPEGMRAQTATRWLQGIDTRLGTPAQQQGAFNRLDANLDGRLTEPEVGQPIWQLLSLADGDDDQQVSLDELKQIRPAELLAQLPGDAAIAAIAHLDANEDGAIAQDEVSERTWRHISAADSNQDDRVTLDEIRAARVVNEDRILRPNPQQAFDLLDTDDDQQITTNEVTESTREKLLATDTNADDSTTLQELLSDRENNERSVRGPIPQSAFTALDLNSDGQLASDEISDTVFQFLIAADSDNSETATLTELLAARSTNERDVRGPAPQAAFERLDLDENSQLTATELTNDGFSLLRQADGDQNQAITLSELQNARSNNELAVQQPNPQAAFDRLDLNEDGNLTESELSTTTWTKLINADANANAALTISELQTARQNNELDVQLPNPAAAFDRLDADDNDSLSNAELTDNTFTALLAADVDFNNEITLQEIVQTRQSNEAALRGPSPNEAFVAIDVIDEGILTQDELTVATWHSLAHADADHDLGLTLTEITNARSTDEAAVDGPDVVASQTAFARLDLNADDGLTQDEVTANTWIRLQTLDADSSGAITLTEIENARLASNRGPVALAFSIDGSAPDLGSDQATATVGTALTVHVFIVQTGTDTRISDHGVQAFGANATYNTEFGSATLAAVDSSFSLFSVAETSQTGLIELSGVSSRLTSPVSSNGESFIRLGSFTFLANSAGTTTFDFVDPNPAETFTDISLGDNPSTDRDLDAVVYRDGASPRTITFRINSVEAP